MLNFLAYRRSIITIDDAFVGADAGKPTITGVVCGHCSPSMSLPMGEEFFLDADACTFRPL